MSLLINKYARTDFTSCEDFFENFKINVPENFNFAYDVIDELAKNVAGQGRARMVQRRGRGREPFRLPK